MPSKAGGEVDGLVTCVPDITFILISCYGRATTLLWLVRDEKFDAQDEVTEQSLAVLAVASAV